MKVKVVKNRKEIMIEIELGVEEEKKEDEVEIEVNGGDNLIYKD